MSDMDHMVWARTWNGWACMVSIREAWTTHGKGSNNWPCETLANHFKACGLEPRPKSMWTRPSPSKEAQSQAREAPTIKNAALSLSHPSCLQFLSLTSWSLSLPLACGAPPSLQRWPKKWTKLGQVALATSSPNLRPWTLALQLFQPLSQ